ncbi:MAG: prepilin-type N-terminal cleavage/methylation domain-containing protein [Candidatus Omnitrophota bacterium]
MLLNTFRTKKISKRGFSLVEVIITSLLISGIILTVASLHLYSIYHVRYTDRTVKVQNDLGFVLAHMQTRFLDAIGNEIYDGADAVIALTTGAGGYLLVRPYVDLNHNGIRDEGSRAAYEFSGNILRYRASPADAWEELSTCITRFTLTKVGASMINNYAVVDITGCFDPDGAPHPCGSNENPEVTMRTNVFLPAVSVN